MPRTTDGTAAEPILVSHDLCPYVQRAVILLTEKAIPHQRITIDLAAKPDWFVAISPLGKVPLLRIGAAVLFESAVICEYLDEMTLGSLHPADRLEKAQHRSWIEFGSSLLNSIAGFYNAPDADAFAAKRRQIKAKFVQLEAQLRTGPYFAGDRFSIVDCAFGLIFRYFDVFDAIDDFAFFDDVPGVTAWRRALAALPSVQGAVVADYPDRLSAFLRRHASVLAAQVPAAVAA